MLTKESSLGFGAALNYPTYEYKSRSGKGTKARYDGGRIEPLPDGFREVIRYATVDDAFAEYLKWLEEEHKTKSDIEMLKSPSGPFIGRWRNARWYDEITRRGLKS